MGADSAILPVVTSLPARYTSLQYAIQVYLSPFYTVTKQLQKLLQRLNNAVPKLACSRLPAKILRPQAIASG